MTRKVSTVLVALAICALLLPMTVYGAANKAAPAAGKKTPFTGTEVSVAPPEGGIWLSDGVTLFFMDATFLSYDEMTDPRVTGNVTLIGNGMWELPYQTGPMWGDVHGENDANHDGPEWDGYWVGMRSLNDEGNIETWLVSTLVGAGPYEGLVVYWYGTKVEVPGETEPIQVSGYIVEARGGPGDLPFQVRGSRVDRLTVCPGIVLSPPPEDPENPYGAIGKVDIVSDVNQSSHVGRCVDQGVGLLNLETGAVSMMGISATANKDKVYWVAVGTPAGADVMDVTVHWAGGTGLFEAAVGGFSALLPSSPQPTDDPMVFLSTFDYTARGTIRY